MLKGIKRSAIRRDLQAFMIPWISVMFLAVALAIWERVGDGNPQLALSASSAIGIALIIIGLSISLLAVFTLRSSYSSTLVIREDHQLVQHGIYRFVRHPVYSGTILALLGMPLCLSSLSGFMVMLLVIPLFLNRIKMEEGLLLEEFGTEHSSYVGRTRKLIPFLF